MILISHITNLTVELSWQEHKQKKVIDLWWNYIIGLCSLPYEYSWSLKFQMNAISPSNLKNKQY